MVEPSTVAPKDAVHVALAQPKTWLEHGKPLENRKLKLKLNTALVLIRKEWDPRNVSLGRREKKAREGKRKQQSFRQNEP